MSAGQEECDIKNYGAYVGLSFDSVRDTLCFLSKCTDTRIGGNSSKLFKDVGNTGVGDHVAECVAPYGAMRGAHANGVQGWHRAPPVVHSEHGSGDAVRAFGAEQWHSQRPSDAQVLSFIGPKLLDAFGPKEEFLTRRMHKLFQSGGLPACNPFSYSSVEIGSMLQMQRGVMRVNSLAIIQQMKLFNEISYFLAALPETRNKFGIAYSKMPRVLLRESAKQLRGVTAHADVALANGAPAAENSFAQRGVDMQGVAPSSYEPERRGNETADAAVVGYTDAVVPRVPAPEVRPSDEAAAMQIDGGGDQMIRTLGFGVEMFALWATCTKVKRFTNDCDLHVGTIVNNREDIFGPLNSVMEELPKFTTKYCAYSDDVPEEGLHASEDEVLHYPIQIAIPRKANYDCQLPSIEALTTKKMIQIRESARELLQHEPTDSQFESECWEEVKKIGGFSST